MQKYIAILRGINVGGHNKLPMQVLRVKMEEWGFKNAITYIQSGNIIFEAKRSSPRRMAEVIEKQILKHFSYTVPTIVFSSDYLRKLIDKNPFIRDRKKDVEKQHVTFLSDKPKKENSLKLLTYSFPPDEFCLGEEAIYIYCPNGYGRSKINNNFFESKLKVTATTRNWKTVNALLEIANG